MLYAKRGVATVSRPSVHPLGYVGDHIGWNSPKIISRLVSLGCSLSENPQSHGFILKGTRKKFGRNRGEVCEKWLSACKSCNVSETGQDRVVQKSDNPVLIVR